MYDFQKKVCQVLGSQGFSIDCLEYDDLKIFKNVVRAQYLDILKEFKADPNELRLPMEEYHKTHLSKTEDHDKAWAKKNRNLSKTAVSQLLSTHFFKSLFDQISWCELVDSGGMGYPEITFRVCRPKPALDVGPLHCDSWFWVPENNLKMPEASFEIERIKFWFSLHNSKNSTGFRYVKKSHLKDYNYTTEERHGYTKPVFNENLVDLEIQSLSGGSGTFIAFNDNLLHGGYVTDIDTRVSIEFTLVVPAKI
jgi:hypothetical protein